MTSKIAHLQMIQAVVSRLAQNSFLLKGWSVLLISASFALASRDTDLAFIYLAYLPVVSFWLLDAYYLRQEKLFRALHDLVRETDEADIDYSMSTESVGPEVEPLGSVAVSSTILGFHLPLLGAVIIVMIVAIVEPL